MPSLINATSTDVNPGLNELLGSIAFNAEHSINECRPLRLVARILQAVLLRNLAIGLTIKTSQFKNAGVMQGCHILTCDFAEDYHGQRRVLGDVLVDEASVPEQFYISDEKLPDWRYLKGSKREERTNKKTGFTYTYSEGAMSFPDATDKPSRTILTGEGGTGASRFKHVIECPDGRFRRLVPDELDQLQGFPKGWTDTGMTDGHRAFCMGNALVTGVPHRIGEAMVKVYGL